MIIELKEPPKSMEKLAKETHTFFQGVDLDSDDCVYCEMAISIEGYAGAIHIEMRRWSKTVKQLILNDWETIIAFCKRKGVKSLVAVNDNYKDKRWPKFIELFGFGLPKIIAVSTLEV